MSTAIHDGETRCVIRLEGDIDISGSAELKEAMVGAISSRKELQVDLEATTDLDVTAVQLLWSAAREAERTGTSFAIVNVPEGVGCGVREMGIENFPAPVTPVVVTAGLPTKSADDR